MVAQNTDGRGRKGAHDLFELVEIQLAVADEISGDEDQIRFRLVGQFDRRTLYFHGGHSPHMQVGEMRDSQSLKTGDVRARSSEASNDEAALGFMRGPASQSAPSTHRLPRAPRRTRS